MIANAAILGSAELALPVLPSLDASSALGVEVARWAARPARLARMDRLCALALVACDGALVDAGLSPDDAAWSPERTGVVVGTAYGCHATNEAYYRGYLADGVAGASPRLFAYTLPSSPVGEISIHHKILGPASTTVGGLVAAIDAIREAMRHLEACRADRMIVASVDVGGMLLARLGVPASSDAAAALVLGAATSGAPRVTNARTRFSAGDPGAAAHAATVEVLAQRRDVGALHVTRLFAPRSLLSPLGPLVPRAEHVAFDEAAHAAAPLVAVRRVLDRLGAGEAALIVAADPVGQGGALLVEG